MAVKAWSKLVEVYDTFWYDAIYPWIERTDKSKDLQKGKSLDGSGSDGGNKWKGTKEEGVEDSGVMAGGR